MSRGGFYKFKNNSECCNSGIPTRVLPDEMRGHMVLVLGNIPGKLNYIKIITVSILKI